MQVYARRSFVLCLFAFAMLATLPNSSAQDRDVVHIVSGVVKHVDKSSKRMIVKADDGVEHSIKWTGKTTWQGTKVSGKGIEEGSKLSVRYTEKAGEKTAVGVKDIGEDTKKTFK